MFVRYADAADTECLAALDRHISGQELEKSIERLRVLVAEESGEIIGLLRYNLFWDNTPFINMLFVRDGFRGEGVGRALVRYWEKELRVDAYTTVMTSSPENERGQDFFRTMGFRDAGRLDLPGEPTELFFIREI